MQRRRDGGFALLLVLFLVAILVAVSAQFAFSTQIDRSLSLHHLREAQHEHALWAGFLHAKQMLAYDLAQDVDAKIMADSSDEPWAQAYQFPVGKATLSVQITDEGSKLDLNRLVRQDGQVNQKMRERVRRLYEQLPLDEAFLPPPPNFPLTNWREDLIDAVVDWIDKDPGGSETGRYETGAKNEGLYTVRELLLVPLHTRKAVYGFHNKENKWVPGISSYVTRWGDGLVNANLASFQVLRSLSERITDEQVNAIIRERQKKRFESNADWQKIPEIQGDAQLVAELNTALRVTSVFFAIHLKSEIGEGEEGRPSSKRAIAYAIRLPAATELMYWDAEPLPTE